MICWSTLQRLDDKQIVLTEAAVGVKPGKITSDGAKTNGSLYSANIERQKAQQHAAEGDREDRKCKYTSEGTAGLICCRGR